MKQLTGPIDYIPIPKEYVFFREDGKQDNDRSNRFYFNLPADWCIADKEETIIGFRTIWMLARRRKLEFNIKVRKYSRNDTTKMSQVECSIVSWLQTDKDLREIWKVMNEQLNIAFRHYNEHQWKEGYPKFFINDEEMPEMYIKNQKRIKDVQMDGYYDNSKKMFIETIYSAANEINEVKVDEDDKNKLCHVDIAINLNIDIMTKITKNNIMNHM